MKIFSAEEIRLWDQYTIRHEPIPSIDLMERAATACADWLLKQYPDAPSFGIFCGKGNNGGDGLAIARLLLDKGVPVSVHILEFGHKGTDDFQQNLACLHQLPDTDIRFIQSAEHLNPLPSGQVVVDAIFGSGLNRAIEGLTAQLVEHINQSGSEIVSIDIPSGLFTDRSSKGNLSVHARYTLSFQCYKTALLVAENAASIGEVQVLDIGLHKGFYEGVNSRFELADDEIIHSLFKPRNRFAHKGNFGHAILLAGSYGKTGAAVLAARACLRSGTGLLTCHIPSGGYNILQTAVPEAMVLTDFNTSFITKTGSDLNQYDAIGIGPGIGQARETAELLKEILSNCQKPLVLDADALNIAAADATLLKSVPAGSILSPHPKEFERLFGASGNDFERMEKALEKAAELNAVIVLKGHHSFIATPGGRGYFNSTGNAGMATAGSGDVLTGILTGLLAQGYPPEAAALLGVYLHGLAGDLAAKECSQEALVAGDIIDYLGKAYLQIQ
ncbi:MAG: NAD(P)H-hydrate dehydratase [Sphingobacteriales bacterium]|nr:NAD(P)H-hydrate dehydratase [Sphingobacteriales bacterium]